MNGDKSGVNRLFRGVNPRQEPLRDNTLAIYVTRALQIKNKTRHAAGFAMARIAL
jgi:hypothetical protein